MPPLLVGITVHSDTNSIADFQPASRTKCHMSENPPHSPHSELLRHPLMAITGNIKKRLVENMVDSLRRKRLKNHTINLLPLCQSRTPRTIHKINNSLPTNLAHPITTLINEHQIWVTSSAKTVNSLPLNDLVNSPTIFAFSVEA